MALLAGVAVPVLGLDPAGDLVMINPAAEALFAPEFPLFGEPVASLLGFDPVCAEAAVLRQVYVAGRMHTAHCAPLTAGGRSLGHVLTLLECAP